MFTSLRNGYSLIERISSDIESSDSGSEFDDKDVERPFPPVRQHRRRLIALICRIRYGIRVARKVARSGARLLVRLLAVIACAILLICVLTPIVYPSYLHRPSHYRGSNPHQEQVFIAANIVDESLIRGAWGKALLELIDIIGPENVFLSIYENDSGPGTKVALEELKAKVKSRNAIVSGHIDLKTFKPTVQVRPYEHRVKRIDYLAAVRNHAIDPLYDAIDIKNGTLKKFDRLLFLNDVVFSPKDAADLLFATNTQGPDARATYHAACAMDFHHSWKFYDVFALKDNEAYRAGPRFFPWFTNSGKKADSFKAVLRESDAVPVKSCWGGMVAFDAKWFQRGQLQGGLEPLRFRSESDIFWHASECCLIHADLDELVRQSSPDKTAHAQIFVNPFIRVAYDSATFGWLEFARRFERLYIVPHLLASWLYRMPDAATRRLEVPGREANRLEWVYTGPVGDESYNNTLASNADIAQYGHWETTRRKAKPGGFCGYENYLSVIKTAWKPGERMWEPVLAPSMGYDYGSLRHLHTEDEYFSTFLRRNE